MDTKKLFLTIALISIMLISFNLAQAAPTCQGATYEFGCGNVINESCFLTTEDWTCNVPMVISTNSVQVDCGSFDMVGDNLTDAVYINADSVEIKSCRIRDYSEGVRTWGNLTRISDTNFTNIIETVIFNNGTAGWTQAWRNRINCSDNLGAYGIYIVGSPDSDIQNNTITDCGYGIIGDSAAAYIYGNVLIDIDGNGISLAENSDSSNIIRNSVWDAAGYGFYFLGVSDSNITLNSVYKTKNSSLDATMIGYFLDTGNDVNWFYQNTAENYSVYDGAIEDIGFFAYQSDGNNVSQNNFTNCYNSMEFEDTADNLASLNNITWTEGMYDYCWDGIHFEDGIRNTAWWNFVKGCSNGIYFDGESNGQISKNTIIDGIYIPYGVWVTYSTDVTIVNNIITNHSDPLYPTTSYGITVGGASSGINITGNNITTSDIGIGLYGIADSVVGSGNRIIGSLTYDLVADTSFGLLTTTTTDEGTFNLAFSNIYLVDYAGTIPALQDWRNIGIAYNISNTSATNKYASINITYNPLTVTNESNLMMWKYDGANWAVCDGGVNTVSNYVYSGNMTSFSIVAPLEQDITDTDLDSQTCTMFWFVLMISIIALVVFTVGFGYVLLNAATTGESFNSQDTLAKLIGTFIGIIVAITFIIYIADQYTAMCVI